jgi:23S rRNA pseudouridine1911/1915/1917 synthase
MVHGLLFHFQNLSKAGGESRPGIVHRLDKWTSGLLVVAKDDWTHSCLSRAFQERKVQKSYLALVHGRLANSTGEISFSIGRHSTIRTRMSAHAAKGRRALSKYRVIEEFRGFSLIEVEIMTGRTHQIRVHLSAIGHPVVGDNVYGESEFREFSKKYGALDRYFLHASELQFAHPKSGAELQFSSPLPGELRTFLERIRT